MSIQVRTPQTGHHPNHTYSPPPSRAAARAIFIVSAAAAAWIGGWAESAPDSFYRSFPGFGRHWISALGPYNEHLLRDFGGLNLGLAAACLVAGVALTRSAAICAAAASLAYALPHILFH